MIELADIHCHLIPYVDDGAYEMEESEELLRTEVEQGVRTICFTPHLRQGMFETADEDILKRFDQVRAFVEEAGLPLLLYHSREYHYDELFRRRLEAGTVRPMGEGRTLLVEFGHRHGPGEMRHAVKLVQEAGYQPLLAHLERFDPIQKDPELAEELVSLGARIQVNAGSVLGREGFRQKRLCGKLIKKGLVYVIGSDAHDLRIRKPELKACADYMEKKTDRGTVSRLMCSHPLSILKGL